VKLNFEVLIRKENEFYFYCENMHVSDGFRGFCPDEIWIKNDLSKESQEAFMPMLALTESDKIHYV
jgi:hypothetical protein